MQNITVGLAALDLDLENPRINPADHQSEALRLILATESIGDKIGEKVVTLARSICELGGIDPSERIVALTNPETPGRYTVLDGNRRLTALKLLSEPALLDREDIGLPANVRRRLHALRTKHDIDRLPKTLEIVVFDSREEAKPFLSLKHTGERDGAGRSSWKAMQQARFESTGAYHLLLRLRADNLLNAETIRQIENSDFPISTFTRLAASTEFSARLGGRIASDGYDEGTDAVQATKGWARIANDTASGEVTSRSHPTTDEIRPYLEKLQKELAEQEEADGPDPSDTSADSEISAQSDGGSASEEPVGSSSSSQSSTPNASGSSTEPQPGPSAATSAPPKVRTPRVRQYLIDRKNPLSVTNQKCKKIHDELMECVKVNDAPYATALLLRTFIEMTAHHYLTHFGLSLPKNATDKIQALAQDLIAQPRMNDEPADRKTLGTALMREANAYEDLSNVAHNIYANLSPEHVRATWDSVLAGLELAWRRISHARIPAR